VCTHACVHMFIYIYLVTHTLFKSPLLFTVTRHAHICCPASDFPYIFHRSPLTFYSNLSANLSSSLLSLWLCTLPALHQIFLIIFSNLPLFNSNLPSDFPSNLPISLSFCQPTRSLLLVSFTAPCSLCIIVNNILQGLI